jgi:hypothetical protein
MTPSTSLFWYGLAAVVGGVLFTISDFVALLISLPDDPSHEFSAEAYAGWAALSLFTLALLQVALIGLYAPQRESAGTLGLVGFFLAFFGMAVAFFVILIYALVASPGTADDPELLGGGPPGALLKYFPLFTLGWLLLGVVFWRSRVYSRAAALLLMVGAVLVLHPHPITNVVFSVALAWLGLTLLSRRDPRREQPQRVI